MNIFLIRESAYRSAVEFKRIDPVRARKQLLECCQILASVDILLEGSTNMRKSNGESYRLAHQHHPITKRCAKYWDQWCLCYDVARTLADEMPGHACAISLHRWATMRYSHMSHLLVDSDARLLVCRLGFEPTLVDSRQSYSVIMSDYLQLKHLRDKEAL